MYLYAPMGNFDFGPFIRHNLIGGMWDCFHTNIIYHLLCH